MRLHALDTTLAYPGRPGPGATVACDADEARALAPLLGREVAIVPADLAPGDSLYLYRCGPEESAQVAALVGQRAAIVPAGEVEQLRARVAELEAEIGTLSDAWGRASQRWDSQRQRYRALLGQWFAPCECVHRDHSLRADTRAALGLAEPDR